MNDMTTFIARMIMREADKSTAAGQISHREGETYDNKRSMGIGLSVCKSIIDAHRGKVWAENKIDGGAKISFTLPLEEEEQNGD